jgi:hypothetical protein
VLKSVRQGDSYANAERTTETIVATSDSAILDACGRWIDLCRAITLPVVEPCQVIDLSENQSPVA